MVAKNSLLLLDLTLAPRLRQPGKQLNLVLKTQPPAILRLNPMGQLVSGGKAARDVAESTIENRIQVEGGQPFILLATLAHDIVITVRINFDVSTIDVPCVAVSRELWVVQSPNLSC